MRVLIIGPRFHYFNQSVERAFRALGHETRILTFDNPIHPYGWTNKVRYKFASASRKTQLKRQSRALYLFEAELAFQQFEPDWVFVMNGDMLLPETLLHWRGVKVDDPTPVEHPAKVALWFFDSFTHIPFCEENIPAVDAVFCYEQTDLPLIRERFGIEAQFLPQAVDSELYHPLDEASVAEPTAAEEPSGRYAYDLVFAGDVFHSKRRQQLLQAVVARYPQLRICIWGEYKPWYKNPWKWLTRERRDVYRNCNTTARQLNHDYNVARMVLNIHIEQQKDGANPKVYEIAASGAYQICDANPYIEQLFSESDADGRPLNESIGLYHNEAELFARIDEALQLTPAQLRAKGETIRQFIINHHTFIQRIEQCVRNLA